MPTDVSHAAARPIQMPDPLVARNASLSPTPLALQPFRTQLSGRPQDRLAFIAFEGRNRQIHRAGALLPNGAQIASIAHDHVTLRRDDLTPRLALAGDRRPESARKNVTANALDAVGGPLAESVAIVARPGLPDAYSPAS